MLCYIVQSNNYMYTVWHSNHILYATCMQCIFCLKSRYYEVVHVPGSQVLDILLEINCIKIVWKFNVQSVKPKLSSNSQTAWYIQIINSLISWTLHHAWALKKKYQVSTWIWYFNQVLGPNTHTRKGTKLTYMYM